MDASPTIVNNTIVAFNSSGIAGAATAELRYNCVYGNTVYNYPGVTDPTGTNGNISVDPLFAGRQSRGRMDSGARRTTRAATCAYCPGRPASTQATTPMCQRMRRTWMATAT